MKNPNSKFNRIKRYLLARWSAEDYPGGEPRFQLFHLGKDMAIFILLPIVSIVLFKSCENAANGGRKPNQTARSGKRPEYSEASKSQIISFEGPQRLGSGAGSFPKRSPGTLVKVRLLNVVETFGTAPVHAQIVDTALGSSLVGGTLIGDATPDSNFDRISINFRFVRDPRRDGNAASITARALNLDGTLGLPANKKEGFFTRSTLSAADPASQEMRKQTDSMDLKHIMAKALATGLLQEFGSSAQVEKNRSQVLTLQPSIVFYAELTDFFPGAAR